MCGFSPTPIIANSLEETIDFSDWESSTLAGFQRHAYQAVVRAVGLAIVHVL